MKTNLTTPEQATKFINDLLSDIRTQPEWRGESAACEDYYDGLQMSPEVANAMDERGQPAVIYNLIHPTINGVLGMEAKTRTDPIVKPDDDLGEMVAEAMNQELHEAVRMTKSNRACSDAFARQVKAGAGFVEVRANGLDPFGYPTAVDEIDWADTWWDWRAKRADLQDGRYMARERMVDYDILEMMLPDHKDLLEQVFSSWDALGTAERVEHTKPHLLGAFKASRDFVLMDSEWNQAERRQARLYEVYYRKYQYGEILHYGNTREILNMKNPVHIKLLVSGQAHVKHLPYPMMRRALFLGPHLISDGKSPHPHNDFPWTPFFAYREGRSRIPYGMIRGMMSPQDTVNFRHSMLTWLLKARRIVMDHDAVSMSDSQLMEQVSRMDGIIKLNPDRQVRDQHSFKIESDFNISNHQFALMQDAKTNIQDVSGMYNSALGKSETGVTSGVAINNLVEQASITMSEVNDNYMDSRRTVNNQLLAHCVHNMANRQKKVQVYKKNSSRPTQEIVLNQRLEDGTVNNSVLETRMHVVLSDAHSTPTYRMQMLERLMTLTSSLPDQLKVLMIDKIIELSDVPEKEELVKRIQQATGLNNDPSEMTPEQQQEMAAKQKQEQMAIALEMAEKEAKVKGLNADSDKKLAEVQMLVKKMDELTEKMKLIESQTKLNDAKADEVLSDIMMQQATVGTQMANEVNQLFDSMPIH